LSAEPALDAVSIWDYLDYRAFLRDSFAAARAMGNPVSNRWLARRLGFRSFSFITMLLQGKRNLTRPNRERFARLLGLDSQAEAYFAALVEYNQARLPLDRERALQALSMLRKPGAGRTGLSKELRLDEDGYRLLRELLEEFRIRAEAIAENIEGSGGEGERDYRLELRLFPLAPAAT
jgi:hypothetical protein